MYSLLRFLAPPRSPSTNSMEPNSRSGRNWCRFRPRTKSHGDPEGAQPSSLRSAHAYAPYPSPYPLRAPNGPSHRSSPSRGSRRPYPALQFGQGGWHPMPPSASSHHWTILAPTDPIHQPGSITTSFSPNIGAELNSPDLSIDGGNREEWGGHPTWDAHGSELSAFTSFCLSRVYH